MKEIKLVLVEFLSLAQWFESLFYVSLIVRDKVRRLQF